MSTKMVVFRPSLRTLLALVLVVVNVGLAAVVAIFAYRAARDAMVDQALGSVALVAQGRDRELRDLLESRQQRLEGFLASLESLCAERNPSGTLGLEDQCVRAAVGGLHRSERATTTDLQYRNRRLALFGERATFDVPASSQLAKIDASDGTGRYVMRAVRNELAVAVQFDLDDINKIFADRAGVEANGETFLTDGGGVRLTSGSLSPAAGAPVRMPMLDRCLSGTQQAVLTTDDRGLNVISGLRPITLAGAGCIVADVSYDDAMLPVRRLGSLLAWAAGLLGLLGGLVTAVVTGLVTRPIKRLALAAERLGHGDLNTSVPVAGTAEVRQLGRTLSDMAASVRDLVLREQNARLHAEAASRTKDDFLATLSHELRTPLNAILGWASILTRTDYDKSRTAQAVSVIERNARLQSQMIEELLDVSRVATGRVRLNMSQVPVAVAIDAAVESVRPVAEGKGVSLRIWPRVEGAIVKADPQRLQQIIWNLLDNAVRFTPAGGRVEVTARRSIAGCVDIIVADSGSGIAPEFLPHVFERFRQADSRISRAHGGLGLGLAIVRDLVEMHSGSVRADSPGEDQGTTVIVRLPESDARAEAEEQVVRSNGQLPQLTGTHVLVVDDDADARDVLRTMLEDAGAHVTTSASAQETREIFDSAHPDLLIADIGMPEEDGYSLMLSIRNLEDGRGNVPAIALTAHTRPVDVEQAMAAGFQLHMPKPVDSSRLVASIASLVVRPA